MTIQTVELAGRRFVILPEEEFHELARAAQPSGSTRPEEALRRPRFAHVEPLRVSGIPASELLIQDRR